MPENLEGKFDPTTQQESLSAKAVDGVIDDLIHRIHKDVEDRQQWSRRQAHFLRRRYCKEFRDTDWPWPNAADICLPVIDMAIDRLKPLVVQSTIGTRPVVTIVGMSPDSQKNVANAELVMDHLMEVRIPNPKEEVSYGADSWCQHGHTVFKTWYDYRTRVVREYVDRASLPSAFQSVLAPAEFSEEDADRAFAETGTALVTKKELKAGESPLRQMLRAHFALDPSDKLDKAAEQKLVNWLVDGSGEGLWIKRREVYRDTPRFQAVQVEDLILPSWTTDIQDARRICHRIRMTEEEIRERARDSKWNKDAVEEIFTARRETNRNRRQARRPGLIMDTEIARTRDIAHADLNRIAHYTNDTDELYELWEVYTYLDLDGDDVAEKVVITLDPISGAVLRVIELPFAHGQWPFVAIKREHTDRLFYHSRGIPELLDDLDIEMTAQHRAKLNAMTIETAPMYTYRISSNINPATIRFLPGQGIPRQRPDDVTPVVWPSRGVVFEREEQVLSGWIERRIGTQDQTLTEQGRLTRPRTATEIRSIGSVEARTLGAGLLLWHTGMARVYAQLWDLWIQYGPAEVWVRITGEPESTELRKLSRADIQGDYQFVPTPAALSDPGTRAQDAQTMLQTLTQAAQFQQLIEPEFEMSLGEALLMFLESIDSRRSRRIIRRRSPEEVQKIQAALQRVQNPQLSLSGDLNDVAQRVRGVADRVNSGQAGPNVTVRG